MKNIRPLVLSLMLTLSASAQSILQTAGDFTALGGTAITSTGVVGTDLRNSGSSGSGLIGLAPAATSNITGFPPGLATIVATGSGTSQARLDLITAQTGLAGMAPTTNMSGLDLGGTTLLSGVYAFDAAATLNGTLTLNANFQNNVFWVFQIGSTFITTASSAVTFINFGTNGGSDLGLFWNVGTAVTTGASNTIAGNYLAGTSITFGAANSGGSRALALAGVTFDNDQLNSFGGPGGGDLTGGAYLRAGEQCGPEHSSRAGGDSLASSAQRARVRSLASVATRPASFLSATK